MFVTWNVRLSGGLFAMHRPLLTTSYARVVRQAIGVDFWRKFSLLLAVLIVAIIESISDSLLTAGCFDFLFIAWRMALSSLTSNSTAAGSTSRGVQNQHSCPPSHLATPWRHLWYSVIFETRSFENIWSRSSVAVLNQSIHYKFHFPCLNAQLPKFHLCCWLRRMS